MALRIRTAIRDGIAHALTRNGLVLTGLYLLATVFQMGLIYVVGTTYVPPSPETAAAPPAGSTPAAGSALPPIVSALATGLGSLTGGLLTIPVSIIGIRTFVSDRTDVIPEEFVFHRLARASVTAFGAGLVVALAYFVAMFLPLIAVFVAAAFLPGSATTWIASTWPGRAVGALTVLAFVIPAAVVFVSLLFVTHEIAVKDRGLVDGLRGSWSVTQGNRLRLLGLYLVILIPQIVLFVPASVLLPSAFGQELVTAVTVPLSIATMSVIAHAYVQLSDEARDSLPRPTEKL